MIVIRNGDLLNGGNGIICHQVNLQGVMGGGLALQIAKRYPECEKEYQRHVGLFFNTQVLLGTVHWYKVKDGENTRFIANCFTQRENFDTDYTALKKALSFIEEYAKKYGFSVGLPWGYGCGIANGEWSKVLDIIIDVFGCSEVVCEIWRL